MERLIILGSGPAGLTAALYAARGGLAPLVLEGLEPGGQLMQTQHVANFPGWTGPATGPAIIAALRRQAETAGARFVLDAARAVDFTGTLKRLQTLMGDTYEASAVIVATGAGVAKTGLPGEADWWGRGISACLTCDGAFYAQRRVAVIGSGPAAAAAARYLTGLGAEVVAVCAAETLAAFAGADGHLTHLVQTDGTRLAVDGAFLVTARRPQTEFLAGHLTCDAAGHLAVRDGQTSVPGVFAAGDCTRARHKQAVIAAGDGALAALEAQRYLATLSQKEK